MIFYLHMSFVSSYDIFFLYETHVVGNDSYFSNCSKYFPEFTLSWIPASKQHKYGRPSGGALYGIKKKLKQNFEFEKFRNIEIVSCSICGNNKFYIVPTYLNCSFCMVHFTGLVEFISEYSDFDFVVIGDINARTGSLQKLGMDLLIDAEGFDYIRNSKDGIVNARGKKFVNMCDEFGLVILNGRSRSDPEGYFTYISTLGSSVTPGDVFLLVLKVWLNSIMSKDFSSLCTDVASGCILRF